MPKKRRKMPPKPPVVHINLRLPPALHKMLVESAASREERTSLNSEIIALIRTGLRWHAEAKESKPLMQEWTDRIAEVAPIIRQHRESLKEVEAIRERLAKLEALANKKIEEEQGE
jgi:GTP1/Obg family GTP-binding protein